ncbi:MAG: hypothetical protein Q7T61_01085 [Caulobacter sp.]|nr:hypothetical protein [Caulobacter sp.]
MQTAADRDFTMGLRLLLAARKIDELTDDYARERLQPLALSYRERGNALMQGVGAQHART